MSDVVDVKSDGRLDRAVFVAPPARLYSGGFKRVLDTILILLSLPLVLPVVALLALVVATDGHSPFYSQKRIGKNGRVFRMWKLRTMVHNADAQLKAHLAENPAAAAEWAATQKLKQDPRITRVGRLLRKTSIDELPQLWNVFSGSMALVGPRPMMVEQRNLYPGMGYFRQKPGITGLWQVSDRNECDFRERAEYDDAYDRTVSLGTDLRILVQTVGVVFKATGY